ncbi:MAG: biopolymer transporter ExbD [Phycisphaerales bacterium]
MRIRPRKRRGQQGVVLNMSSMIDCTFLLLSYFLITTASMRPEDRLSPNLRVDRDAASGSRSDFQPQVVEAVQTEAGPRYRLGDRLFADRPSLTEALRPLRKEAGLFVRVQDKATVGFAAGALQAGRDAGFEQVTYVPAKR